MLIQRLKLRGSDLILDYMGAAEFEFGALRRAVREALSIKNRELIQIYSGKYKAWFSGPPDLKRQAQKVFETELWGQSKLIEPTRIKESYCDPDPFYANFVGWWSIDPGNSWALFKNEYLVERWLNSLPFYSSRF